MRCLTRTEQTTWLKERGMSVDPYWTREPDKRLRYCQYKIESDQPLLQLFLCDYWKAFGENQDCLMDIAGIPHEFYYHTRLFQLVRYAHDEKRPLKDAPGLLFTTDEETDAKGLFLLSVTFEWNSYLYFPGSQVTLLNWEGELMDFWAYTESNMSKMGEVMEGIGWNKSGRMRSPLAEKSLQPADPSAK